MDADPDGPPRVALPERFDRRLRLGPFPSARDALKFVVYAAAAAVLAPFASPIVWLPIVAAGFGLAVFRPEGEAIDERALAFVLWHARRRGRRGAEVTAPRLDPLVRRGLLPVGSGPLLAVVRAGGVPLTYLPPRELRRRFEIYCDLLRALDGGFAWSAGTTPLRPGRLVPRLRPSGTREADGCAGYRDLVEAFARRRALRRVDIALSATELGPEGIGGLERRVALYLEALAALGVPAARLTGRSLLDAGRRLGWPPGGTSP
ncbi:MAG TPA: hypothetical protein VMG81_07205 [Thermoplasmata archaeon]|nr:hypothetical protein [Thermoplasmata archaeon]